MRPDGALGKSGSNPIHKFSNIPLPVGGKSGKKINLDKFGTTIEQPSSRVDLPDPRGRVIGIHQGNVIETLHKRVQCIAHSSSDIETYFAFLKPWILKQKIRNGLSPPRY